MVGVRAGMVVCVCGGGGGGVMGETFAADYFANAF